MINGEGPSVNAHPDSGHPGPIELLFHNIHDHGTRIADMWIREVQTRSGGRVRFRQSRGEDREAIRAADVVRDVPARDERYRLLSLVQVPFVFPGSTVGSRVIARLYAEFPELRTELSDVKVVGLGVGAMMALFSGRARGPVRTLEDFRGAKTRSLPAIDDVIAALGGRPEHVGFFEMPRLLETGRLDAAVLGLLPAYQFRLADGAAPYCTLAGDLSITMHPMRIYMRWDSWNRLPPDVRDVIDEIGPSGADGWFALESGPDADGNLREAMDYFEKQGEIIKLAPGELRRWQRLIDPLRTAAVDAVEAAGLPGRRFFNRMNELVSEYSGC
jgi:TRAP-type C4-dicarboxylate transport system substrate-binding protein